MMAGSILRYKCDYCDDYISGIEVKCAANECVEFRLCLHCFRRGAEIGHHKKNHKYILNDYNSPVFPTSNSKWTPSLEACLLTALEDRGYGNWAEVTQMLTDLTGSSFTQEEVQDHYNKFYVLRNVGKISWESESRQSNFTDHTAAENGVHSLSLKLIKTEQQKPKTELTTDQEHEIGFMQYTEDFQKEYDNESESLFQDLVFDDVDDLEKTLELAVADMYRRIVKDRFYRKKVVSDHDLVGLYFQQTANKHQKSAVTRKKTFKDCESLEEFQEKMTHLTRFFTHSDMVAFFNSLQKEKTLRNEIELKSQKNGLVKSDNAKSHSKAKPVKISSLPGYGLLSYKEKKLCASLKLHPNHYISFKGTILKADGRRRPGKETKFAPLCPSGWGREECRKILDFMRKCGWIKHNNL